jgi:hypothetical protein
LFEVPNPEANNKIEGEKENSEEDFMDLSGL